MSINLCDPRVRTKLCAVLWPTVCIMLFKAFPAVKDAVCAKFDMHKLSMFNCSEFVQAFVNELTAQNVTWTDLCAATIESGCGSKFLANAEMELMKECTDIPVGYRGFYHIKQGPSPPSTLRTVTSSSLAVYTPVRSSTECSLSARYCNIPMGVLTTTPVDLPVPYKLPKLTL